MSDGHEEIVTVGGAVLTTRRWGSGPAGIVLLHDGLGSIAQWRGVPAALRAATGRAVLAYDRAGHGRSTPVPTGPWPVDWWSTEAGVVGGLLQLMAGERPVLVGHSDGASIALLHAAAAGDALAGVVALAPHSYVEPCCVEAIAALRNDPGRTLEGLARYHAHPAAVFEAWSGVWVSDAFRSCDVRSRLGAISVPILVVQGDGDEYATPDMVHRTVAAIGPSATGRLVPDVGHLVHHDAPALVVELVSSFVAESDRPRRSRSGPGVGRRG